MKFLRFSQMAGDDVRGPIVLSKFVDSGEHNAANAVIYDPKTKTLRHQSFSTSEGGKQTSAGRVAVLTPGPGADEIGYQLISGEAPKPALVAQLSGCLPKGLQGKTIVVRDKR